MQGAATFPRPERWREELDHLVEAGTAIGLYSTAERQKGGGITPHHHLISCQCLPLVQTSLRPSIKGASKCHAIPTEQAESKSSPEADRPRSVHDDCFKAKPALHLNSSACLLNNCVLAKKYIQESILRDMAGNTNLHIVS